MFMFIISKTFCFPKVELSGKRKWATSDAETEAILAVYEGRSEFEDEMILIMMLQRYSYDMKKWKHLTQCINQLS